jgi:hypothetical protein
MASDKVPFYIPKPDQKYSILKNGIAVDSDTSKLSTRVVNPSTALQLATETAVESGVTSTIKHLLGQTIDFDFSVSPGKYIDWDNSVVEFRDKLAYYKNATTAIAAVTASKAVVPWNLTFTKFDEVHLNMNGTSIFDKTASEYSYTQTTKAVMEYSNDELNACSAVYAPVGDERYHSGVASASALAIATDQNSMMRNDNWLTTNYDQEIVKSVSFKDLFFSIPGLSSNLRNIKMGLKFKSKIPLAFVDNTYTTAGENCGVFPQSVRIILHEYNLSPSTASTGLSDKMAGAEEHIAFVDVETRKIPYSSDMAVNNQKNIQYVVVAQFADEVDSKITTTSSFYRNPSQTMLCNGYAGTTVATATILLRSDIAPTGNVCVAPPSSIQAEIAGVVYPSNAINLTNSGASTVLNHAELYEEYRKACGKKCPAIDENTFKRTMPFFVVKPNAGNKLVQSGDIIIRLPGLASTTTGSAGAQVRILYGKLKGYTIATSGAVSEALSSY